ncbi:MAG: hypothetical protein IJ520_05030 [Synergistaceae bacterium]|nr:hypothetical protein [Synergistaceae bacterium]MBR1601845.1 hypothetical protein [Synergistaceae bacterium]MBR1601853.1 hypothetical protein [Synergistaceae bacterium]
MKSTHNEQRKQVLRWLNNAISYFINSLDEYEPDFELIKNKMRALALEFEFRARRA